LCIVPLPDAPLGVQVEAGPQRGTLLVMWTPVPDKKPVDEEAAELIRVITGYTVYVDGTLVKQLDSPTGQSPQKYRGDHVANFCRPTQCVGVAFVMVTWLSVCVSVSLSR